MNRNWQSLVGLLATSAVGYVALSHWSLGGWMGVVISLAAAVGIWHFLPSGEVIFANLPVRLAIGGIGLIAMLCPQPGITFIGYHAGDLLFGVGIALVVSHLAGWRMHLTHLCLVILTTSLVYSALTGYLWTIGSAAAAILILVGIIWLAKSDLGISTPLGG